MSSKIKEQMETIKLWNATNDLARVIGHSVVMNTNKFELRNRDFRTVGIFFDLDDLHTYLGIRVRDWSYFMRGSSD